MKYRLLGNSGLRVSEASRHDDLRRGVGMGFAKSGSAESV